MGAALQVCVPERGHQTERLPAAARTSRPPPAYQHSPVVSEYFRHCEEERRRSAASGPDHRQPRRNFPEHRVAFAPAAHDRACGIRAGRTRPKCWRWYLVDGARQAEVKDFLRDYYIRYSGPAGMTEQDDMENWNYAHAASRGTIARRYPYSYEQGLD